MNNRAYLSLLSKFVPGLLVAFIINSFFVRNVRCFHSATKPSFRRGSSLIPPRILLQCKLHERHTVFPSALVKHKGHQSFLYSTTNMDDSEEVGVKHRRSTRNKSTPQIAKEDHADAKVALDASPTKPKKKVVKRKVTALSAGSAGDESEASAASVKKKMKVVKKKVVKKKVVERKVTKSTIKTPEDASDDEASAISIVSAKASPKKKKIPATKKEKSPVKKTKTAKTEPQRLTEKDELTKLWNAEEARENYGSYSKYPIKCIA
jgi:hypothetical protein